MVLARLIQVAEEQRRLLSQYTLTNPDSQIDTLKHLSNIYLDQASTITTIIINHEASLAEECSPILDEVKAVMGKLQEGRFTFGSPTRKSFEAIYTSQPARDSESSDLKRRTNKQYTRALEIQKLGCDGAIVLAGALTTSTWSQLMTSPKLKYILKNMPKPPQTCSQVLLHTLETWGDEPPLANCAAFTNALTGKFIVPIGAQTGMRRSLTCLQHYVQNRTNHQQSPMVQYPRDVSEEDSSYTRLSADLRYGRYPIRLLQRTFRQDSISSRPTAQRNHAQSAMARGTKPTTTVLIVCDRTHPHRYPTRR